MRRTFTRSMRSAHLAIAATIVACGSDSIPTTTVPSEIDVRTVEFAPELMVDLDQMTRHDSGLYFEDIDEGDGVEAEAFYLIEVEYRLWLADGTLLEDTRGADPPFVFQIGTNLVIAGWDIGLLGMKPGGRRRLVIPPQLAYGPLGVGSIPPNGTLVFDVMVLTVEVI